MSIKEVWPSGMMALLTQNEANSISLSSRGKLYELYRKILRLMSCVMNVDLKLSLSILLNQLLLMVL